jgi:poly-gamma-glutamate synthesis protein (capsule biosynthesis protein)
MEQRHSDKKLSTRKRMTIVITIGVLIIASATTTAILLLKHDNQSIPMPNPKATTTPAVEQKVTSSMAVVGEVFWGRGIEYFANRSTLKYAFPFSGLSTDIKNKYDNWIGDLECPVTTTDIPYQTQVDYLKFNCRPEYLSEAKKWFNIFTLANNHSFDNRGAVGESETRSNLEAAGIQYFGSYDVTDTSNICEVVAMNAKATTGTTSKDIKIPVAMCGYMLVVDTVPTDAELAVIKKYSEVMPVIVMPHMGVEYRPTAEDVKVESYHRMIDAGADVVLATHPHVIQNSENYKGRLIQYSAGNFMFDQQSIGHNNTLSLAVTLQLQLNDQNAIKAYEEVGPNCSAFKDSCLAQLQSKITSRPTFSVSYGHECFYEPNYYPKPADTATCNEILQQSTWQTATANLSPTW